MNGKFYAVGKMIKRNLRLVFPKFKKVPGSIELYISEVRLQCGMDYKCNLVHIEPVLKRWVAPKESVAFFLQLHISETQNHVGVNSMY